MKPLWYYKVRVEERVRHWLFWKATGWPFARRCPQCAGDGLYSSDMQARYGDPPHKCDMCGGTGRIARMFPTLRKEK